jgi:nucleotide-binding universal stress UspA family protein
VRIFHHILVPVDDSEHAEKAADFAIGFAATQSRLTFVYAVDIKRIYGLATQTPFMNPTSSIDASREKAQRIVARLVNRAKETNVAANGIVVDGEPVEAVLKVADDAKADLIILTTHGRSGIARLWMGSIAEGIIRQARLPVLIAPSTTSIEHAEEPSHQILSSDTK